MPYRAIYKHNLFSPYFIDIRGNSLYALYSYPLNEIPETNIAVSPVCITVAYTQNNLKEGSFVVL